MNSLALIYENIIVSITSDNNSIRIIKYNNDEIIFDWIAFSEYLINPDTDLFSSSNHAPYEVAPNEYSITSVDMKTNFIRGISVVLILQRLILKEKYIRISSLPYDYTIFTRNNLKALRTALIFHLKLVEEDRLLKHALDFVNRWSCLFHPGDKLDKMEVMTELIIRYLGDDRIDNKKMEVEENTELEARVRRLEAILGVNSH